MTDLKPNPRNLSSPPHPRSPLTPLARTIVLSLLIFYQVFALGTWIFRIYTTPLHPFYNYDRAESNQFARQQHNASIVHIVFEAFLFTALLALIILFWKGRSGLGTMGIYFVVATVYWAVLFALAWVNGGGFINICLGGPLMGMALGWGIYFGVMWGRARKGKGQDIEMDEGRVALREEREGEARSARSERSGRSGRSSVELDLSQPAADAALGIK
ncbi:hypothetical protein C1H76_1665 [Elsinoe australis]|uniref:Uncharacterized protein n=1 Tax=Elsinoe australis TaxID=40998 RepID=A0A4U7B559_9PEZI|nr:hypothetical protein C1H76_1665 [Elsinoe australis]